MKQNTFLSYLASRNKLSFQNIRTGEEYWHLFLNRLHLVGIILGLILISLTAALFLVAYTPILDYIPGNPGEKQRQLLITNILKLDSLENEIKLWGEYNDNVLLALQGNVPKIEAAKVIETAQTKKTTIAARNKFDSLLRVKHSKDSTYLNNKNKMNQKEINFEVMPPAPGMIVETFDPTKGQLGITITPPAGQIIVAALNGTVVLSTWSPKNGNTVAIQHAANIMSIYKNLATTSCKVGDKINAGGPVGTAANIAGGKQPLIQFELWANGVPLNPQMHISF